MHLGWRIFIHSVRQLLLNLGPALQLSALPFLLAGFVIYILLRPYFVAITHSAALMEVISAAFFLRVGLAVALYVVVSIWVAVAWHRFVLLAEYPGAVIARPLPKKMVDYLGASVRVALVALALGIVVGIADSVVSTATGALSPVAVAIRFILQAVLSMLVLRVSVVLPAAAVGKKMTLGEAIDATAGQSLVLFVTAVLISALTVLPQLLGLTPLAPVVSGLVYQICANWLLIMLGISVLTTIYGYFVENRDLL